MDIYDGSKKDTSNRISDTYLQINNCGFQNTRSGYSVVRKNGRDDYHILLINSGCCDAHHDQKEYTLTDGNFVLYAPGEAQQYTFTQESSSLWCHFSGSIIREVLAEGPLQSGVYFTDGDAAVSDAFTGMIQRFHQPRHAKYALPFLLQLLYLLSDKVADGSPSDGQDTLLPILAFINANYQKKIPLEELAKKSGYSKSRFSHLFSETIGTSPLQYQNDIRLSNAKELLSSTNLSITEIALSCGFADPLYFSRIFKKKYNMTPSAYKTQKRL